VGSRASKRLTQLAIKAKTKPGYYPDGDGLYLQVSSSGSTSWVLRYSLNKRAREMGLGSTRDWTLAEAREQVRRYRQLLLDGIDPIQYRQTERERQRVAAAQRRSFGECAREYHELHAHTWKNAKHAAQWISTLTTYVFPVFGNTDISSVNKANILAALEPIWITKPETASRVRQRIRAVLDWAAARDYRVGHDPHLWDQVSTSLPKTAAIKERKHFAACPYPDVPAVLASIRQTGASDVVKAGMEFLILTAVRSGDVRGASWTEIDFENKRWVLPPERQKAGREHRVPLCDRALELLRAQQAATGESPLIFPAKNGRPLSDMAFTEVLRRLGFDFTVHGFRSSFRDWCAEQTTYPREVCEAALAHARANGDDTEASYFRSDLFEKRRLLMAEWARHCSNEKPPAQVISLATM
jgi:integrase